MASKGVEQLTMNPCKHLSTVIDKRIQCSVNSFPTRSHSIVILHDITNGSNYLQVSDCRPHGVVQAACMGSRRCIRKGVPLRPIISMVWTLTFNLSKKLTGLEWQHLGNTAPLWELHSLDALWAIYQEICVSFNDSITKVPVGDALTSLSQHFNEDNLTLIHHVLTSCISLSMTSLMSKQMESLWVHYWFMW
jgi:hypothetical protein